MFITAFTFLVCQARTSLNVVSQLVKRFIQVRLGLKGWDTDKLSRQASFDMEAVA